LRQQEAVTLAAHEATPQARAGLLPSVNLSGNLTRSHRNVEDGVEDVDTGTTTTQGYTLSLVQPVYRRERFVRLRQAAASIRQAEAQLDATRQALVLEAARRYFSVLGALDDLEFSRAEKEAIARQLEQSKQRFEVGLIAITDVQEAQARFDLARAREITAENQLANVRESLRELTGTAVGELSPLGPEIPLLPPQPADVKQWTENALRENMLILAAQYGAETAQENIDLQRAGHYPTLDLVADHSYSEVDGTLSEVTSRNSTIGLQLNIPLYQGGLINSQTREARYQFERALAALEEQKRTTEREVHDTYLGVITGISQVEARLQALKSSQVALEATEAGYEVGTRTAVDVLNAQSQLYSAQRDHARARYDYILSTLGLKQAAGLLSEADCAQVSTLLVKP
jgi:outer membrane protein